MGSESTKKWTNARGKAREGRRPIHAREPLDVSSGKRSCDLCCYLFCLGYLVICFVSVWMKEGAVIELTYKIESNQNSDSEYCFAVGL